MIRRLTDLSLRTRLNLLILSAVIPALAISIYTVTEQRREAIQAAEQDAGRLVSELVEPEQSLITGTRQMLGTLAELPMIRNRDGAACNRLFGALLERYPHYTSIQAADAAGRPFASSPSQTDNNSLRTNRCFRDALTTLDFAPGEFIPGRNGGKPTFNYALPVLDQEGRVSVVLQAEVGIDYLDRLFAKVKLPEKTTVVATDHAGTILYRSHDGKQAIGRPDDINLFHLMLSRGEEGILPQDMWRPFSPLQAFGTIRHAPGAPPHMYIRVIIPDDSINRVLTRTALNLLLLILAAFVALGLAYLLGKREIAEPVEHLVEVARQMADGDMSVRAALPPGQGEICHLARAFNNMAEAQAARERERDLAEEELYLLTQKEIVERAKSEAIIAAIGDGISIQDMQFRILYQNEQHKTLVGDCLGKLCYEAYEPNSAICADCPVAMAFVDRRIHTMERSIQRPDGTSLFVEITTSPVYNEVGKIFAGVEAVRDITQRKQMEDALLKSNREMQHFVYVVSHDLREPLRTITSFIQLFKRRYGGNMDSDADEFIAFIVDGADRMQQLIDDLLVYSRVDSRGKDLVPVDTGNLLKMALDNLHAAIAESGAMVSATELPLVTGDEVQIIQLFQNIIGNAIKFRGASPPVITITCTQEDPQWRFAISDNGIGIDPDNFGRIFDIFQKLNPRERYEGTGIGLAICKKIVERHGGSIWVESQPGNGSTFLFTLRGMAS